MSKKRLAGLVGVFALVALCGLGIQAQAATWGPGYEPHATSTASSTAWMHRPPKGIGHDPHIPMRGMMGTGIFGTVSALNGTTLTVNSKRATTTTTYMVDATNATVFKDKATSTISAILVNDTVVVQGTVTGTNVIATRIVDAKLPMFMNNGKGNGWKNGTSTPPMMHGMEGVFQKIGNFFKGLFHK